MIAIALLLLTAPALAQDQATPPEPKGNYYRPSQATMMVEPVAMMLAGFDTDGDGRTTRTEAETGVARSFGDAKDMGYIGFSDWAERWLGDRNAVPSPFETDRDGDNRVTLDELQSRIGTIFTRLDVDKDGALTHKELLTIRGINRNGPGGPGGGPDGPGSGRPPRR